MKPADPRQLGLEGLDAAPESLEAAAAQLEASPDYRVLRRFVPHDVYAVPDPGAEVARALVIDTETTGTDPATDAVIELAVLAFEYDVASGRLLRIVDVYDGLEDPDRPIPPSATAIHGITDAMVAGQRLDEARVTAMLEGVQWVIAHNAGFDRPLLERRMPVFETLRWACSVVDVPWETEGYSGAKLQYLAIQQGFFFEGHRSEIDCRALLEVLSRPLPKSGGTGLALLLQRAAESRLRLWAINSPFETKDVLRARGYRWDPAKRCWHILVAGRDAAVEEAAWLKAEVYGGRGVEIDVEVIDATVRFSPRPGTRRKRML
ncbi:MAG: 3'-5' exonuclease [Steroidobacteraceae bacterium]|nr:DNA polymerase III subunit epsilon [Nevskiaceae bacterium]MCP5339426.1 DNA polymerase III subunit epsilon [Nevskiaceae bacterium]MCP5360539.1 DNA polymerase III subunit epsilon [Nevskiaceae bacterium]MCP5472886.1 DNA polymerase III subunit epsilon [Nevskiaceae bacterium]